MEKQIKVYSEDNDYKEIQIQDWHRDYIKENVTCNLIVEDSINKKSTFEEEITIYALSTDLSNTEKDGMFKVNCLIIFQNGRPVRGTAVLETIGNTVRINSINY